MGNSFTKDTQFKLSALGVYQVIGGIIGLGLMILIISKLETLSSLVVILLLVAIGLYVYSIYCGILLLKKKKLGLKYSLINQFLQLLSFTILGFGFQYISGVAFLIGLNLTNAFNLTFNLGISSWQISINDGTELLMVNINFVALFLIIFIENLQKKVRMEQIENEIASIGKQ